MPSLDQRRPVIIGNWKMHKSIADSVALASGIRNVLGAIRDIDVGIAPPFTALSEVAKRTTDSRLQLAAQNCHAEDAGAYTGEVAVPMLKDAGCTHVILGHSERRQYFGETDVGVNTKLKAVIRHQLVPVLCIGESLAQREAEQTFAVVQAQLTGALAGVAADQAQSVIVAYEPVWAIGTGKTATTEQAQEVHQFLRGCLRETLGSVADQIRIQYGGSVKPSNISALMAQPDIDGALVGGASLKADDFIAILRYQRG